MTKIVISGYYGFANAGDEAMLSALVTSLREYISDAEITVISGNPAMTGANHQVRTVHRFNLPGIVAAVRSCQILIRGGGSLLQDVTSARSITTICSLSGWLSFSANRSCFMPRVSVPSPDHGPERRFVRFCRRCR